MEEHTTRTLKEHVRTGRKLRHFFAEEEAGPSSGVLGTEKGRQGSFTGKIGPVPTIQQMLERGQELRQEREIGELTERGGRERKRLGARPQKTPQDTVVSPLGTRADRTCQLITWKKAGRRADLKPEGPAGEPE